MFDLQVRTCRVMYSVWVSLAHGSFRSRKCTSMCYDTSGHYTPVNVTFAEEPPLVVDSLACYDAIGHVPGSPSLCKL